MIGDFLVLKSKKNDFVVEIFQRGFFKNFI